MWLLMVELILVGWAGIGARAVERDMGVDGGGAVVVGGGGEGRKT